MHERKRVNKKVPATVPYSLIEITARHCSSKVQTSIQVGKRYRVLNISELSDGTKLLIVEHPCRKKSTLHINAVRFSWKQIGKKTLEEEEKIEKLIQKKDEAKSLLETNFSEKEQRQILFVPSAMLDISVRLAHTAQDFAYPKNGYTDYLSQYKKLSRELNDVFLELDREKYYALGKYGEGLDKVIDDFMDSRKTQLLFTTFLNVLQLEYFRIAPNASDRVTSLRMYAAASYYFVRLLMEQETLIDQLITEKFGGCYPHKMSPNIERLRSVMYKYAEFDQLKFKSNQNIKIGFDALKYAINDIIFKFN